MLRRLRIIFASLFFICITLLFLDFTGFFHTWFGWLAKIQLLPAILAGNVIIVATLIILTLLFGRVYCSVICPMGVMQDIFSHLGNKVWKNRFHYTPNRPILRYSILGVFILLIVLGLTSIASLIAPYSAFGRIATAIFQPIYMLINNLFATLAEHANSYAFYHADVWVKSSLTLIVAAITFILIALLSLRHGRAWCNLCPVGTTLGLFSRFSLFRPTIDSAKCTGCTLCARQCKTSCINPKEHTIDYSRCVACMNCIENCRQGAIQYKLRTKQAETSTPTEPTNTERRKFLATSVAVGVAMTAKAQEMKVDGGLAVIEDKQVPERKTPLKPAGAISLKHFANHCTACQLCVSECPNQVLRPSTKLENFMQPEMNFDKGYCRTTCTRCSQVCPAGAITRITPEEKTDIKIGHAVWIRQNCLMPSGVSCGKCQEGCPAGAILLVDDLATGHKIPSVNESRCIGCGKCEHLCPVRPFSAIYVEGHEQHQ